MRLTNKQLFDYRIKLSRICGCQPVVYENGTFIFYNIEETLKNRIVSQLKRTDFVANINCTKSSKLNFNHLTPLKLPSSYYEIRGILKIESISEDVQLHNTLNPKLWSKDNELYAEVKEKVTKIVEEFTNQLAEDGIDLDVIDIYLIGSNVNYNYNAKSDLDIHIIADEGFDCDEKHLPIIYNAYKTLFNNKYDIMIKDIDAEIYVENKDAMSNISSGIYSLKKGWIKQPSRYNIPDIDNVKLAKTVAKWEDKYLKITTNPTITKIDKYIDELYELRASSLISKNEFDINNLVFKELRNLNYLDNLKNLRIKLKNKQLSLI